MKREHDMGDLRDLHRWCATYERPHMRLESDSTLGTQLASSVGQAPWLSTLYPHDTLMFPPSIPLPALGVREQ
jgi:hypothetical protein